MDQPNAKARFTFLAEAFEGVGGFAPTVTWEDQQVTTTTQAGGTITATRRVPKVAAVSHLVPHPRESPEKYAARCAVAVYENHLREAAERFTGYLGRRAPMRTGADAPLTQLLLQDADLRGTPLNAFLMLMALHAKARGSMLMLLDMPAQPGNGGPVSLLDQIERRAVPFLRCIHPESVTAYQVDPESGQFTTLSVDSTETIDGSLQRCTRTWDAQGWSVHIGDKVLKQGPHPFGRCPVLALTEGGQTFPCIGKYAQIADLSRRVFNARSELDDILRSQTFSLLTMQVPEGSGSDIGEATASIGTHSMLVHQGITPAFIAPDAAPAQTYLAVIDALQQSIKRVAMDEATTESGQAESGVARRLRFERLNADLATFAQQMAALERRMWALFHRALNTTNRVTSEWPTDFNLVDTLAELDVLVGMQTSGFPPQALALKRATIAAAEFDAADEDDKKAVGDAIREQGQEPTPPAEPGTTPIGANA